MRRSRLLKKSVPLALILLSFLINIAEAKVVDEHVYIVPAGKIDGKILENIKSDMPGRWPVSMNVEIFSEETIPESAHNLSSGQYEAGVVLYDIARRITIVPSTERVLVVTDADLYVPDMDFVFGLADEKKGMSIISVARLENGFYGLKPDERLLRERVLKEALHEVAHSRGIDHCRDPKCVMYFSNTLADTDRKKTAFCHDCNRKLYQMYGAPLFKTPWGK